MRGWMKSLLAVLVLTALPGCVAKTLVGVATAPVRVAGKAVDLATTSQSEADEQRGRALRQEEERRGRLERSYRQNVRRCGNGDGRACERAEQQRAELGEGND